jgi:hypothetical protein
MWYYIPKSSQKKFFDEKLHIWMRNLHIWMDIIENHYLVPLKLQRKKFYRQSAYHRNMKEKALALRPN